MVFTVTRLPWDRNRAADDEHVELGIDLDDLKVLDGDSLHTVLAGADLALEDTAGVGGGAHGTGVTVDRPPPWVIRPRLAFQRLITPV